MSIEGEPRAAPDATRARRAPGAARWWFWVALVLLLLLPAALVAFFVLTTPDFASFEYRVF